MLRSPRQILSLVLGRSTEKNGLQCFWPLVGHQRLCCARGYQASKWSISSIVASHSPYLACGDSRNCRMFRTSAKAKQDKIPTSRALTLFKDLKEVKHSPAPALALGFLGLVPFVSVPVYMLFSQTFSPDIAFAQIAYGASILSFLGGVRWGVTLPDDSVVKPDWTNLGYSVAPSLIAWVGLLLPQPLSIFTLIGGLGAAAYFDTAMYGYPGWFKALRFVLTFVAVLSLWTTFMCKYVIQDRVVKKEQDVQTADS